MLGLFSIITDPMSHIRPKPDNNSKFPALTRSFEKPNSAGTQEHFVDPIIWSAWIQISRQAEKISKTTSGSRGALAQRSPRSTVGCHWQRSHWQPFTVRIICNEGCSTLTASRLLWKGSTFFFITYGTAVEVRREKDCGGIFGGVVTGHRD